jgi:hypothetical protein
MGKYDFAMLDETRCGNIQYFVHRTYWITFEFLVHQDMDLVQPLKISAKKKRKDIRI